jgi:hypothetical protein
MDPQNNNLLAILKWSLSQTDGTTPSRFAELSEHDRKFLEDALTEAIRNDPSRLEVWPFT